MDTRSKEIKLSRHTMEFKEIALDCEVDSHTSFPPTTSIQIYLIMIGKRVKLEDIGSLENFSYLWEVIIIISAEV